MKVATEMSPNDSEILHSSIIFHFKIDKVEFGSWIPEGQSGLFTRVVKMQLQIQAVLKGTLDAAAQKPVELAVNQRGRPDGIVMDYYGLWSHIHIADGTELVAFCDGSSQHADILLKNDTHCHRLVPATHSVISDIRAALQVESLHVSRDESVALFQKAASGAGDIFARYMWEKLAPEALQPVVFPRLINILTSSGTSNVVRDVLVSSLYDKITSSNSTPVENQVGFIRALIAILEKPGSGELDEHIVQMYLPNLLGLRKSRPTYSFADIYPDRKDRDKAAALVQKFPQSKLNMWIDAGAH